MARVTFVLALAGHLVALYAPATPAGVGLPGLDKIVHATIFAAVAVTGLWAGLPRVPLLAALVVHAPLSEVVQAGWLADRGGDPLDVVADLVGVSVGALLVALLAARVGPHRPARERTMEP